MIWVATLACAISAALHLALVVPHLPEPEVGEDESGPRYATLATGRDVLLLAAVVLGLSQVLHLVPPQHVGMWCGYLGAGAALVWVDLRTTWLPLVLHKIFVAEVVLGLLWVAAADWSTALASAAGGAVAFLLFHLMWRFTPTFGYGDVRLAAVVGAMGGLGGLSGWLVALLCGTLLGAVWGVAHTIRRHGTDAPAHFAYGPALWLGPVAAAIISGW